MMKRIFHMFSLLAIINLFALAGLVAFMFMTGKLSAERVDQIAMVLRGEFPETQPEAETPTTREVPPEQSHVEIARKEDERRRLNQQEERVSRELEYRFDLNQQILYQANQELEETKRLQKMIKEQREQFQQEHQEQGFEQMLKVIKGTQPKKAVELLMVRKDADVVRIFMALNANVVTDIINSCKTPEQIAWARRILPQLEKQEQ
jgi:flagellar motility protein MotE (MotC chaperone)